jgi:O-antigen/teichoic acid export membrane protein
MKLDKLMLKYVLKMYGWFFKTAPTKDLHIFAESILFVFIATGIAKSLMLIMNIVGGRILGSALYGEYTLLLSITSFLMIPIGFAVQGGLMKYLADVTDAEKQKKIISTAFIYFGLTLAACIIIYVLFLKQLASMFHAGETVFLISVALLIFWSATAFFELVLKSLHQQKQWSYMTAASYFLASIIFIALIVLKQTNILLLLIPTLIIYIFFASMGGLYLRKYYSKLEFDKKEFNKMFKYGIFVFIITISTTFLGNIDKVMINLFMGADAIGIYQAYFLSSVMIIGVLLGVFVNVFAPTAIKLKDTKGLLKKIDKLVLISSLFLIVLIPIIQFVVLYLYNYPFNITTSLFFTIATILTVGTVLFSVLLDVQSIETVKKSSTGVIIAFIINIPLNYLFIPLWGINGAIIATAISYFLLLIYIRYNLYLITSEKIRLNKEV